MCNCFIMCSFGGFALGSEVVVKLTWELPWSTWREETLSLKAVLILGYRQIVGRHHIEPIMNKVINFPKNITAFGDLSAEKSGKNHSM